jgi:large subunit ribosomal protein L21
MDYAIIRVGNKQHRVRDGETLVVDRVHTDEGGTFAPDVLLGGDGVSVTVKVLAHERGPKIRIGKYRKRTGYKRHNGFRAATSRIEVSLGHGKATSTRPAAAKADPKAEAATAAPKPKAAAQAGKVTSADPVAAGAEATPEAVAKAPKAKAAPQAGKTTVAKAEAKPEAAAKAPKPKASPPAGGLPAGYEALTIAAIVEGAKKWSKQELAAALAHEQENKKRKGALAALESSLAAKETS